MDDILKLDRNDVDGAMEIVRSRPLTPEEWRVLVLLQDDPKLLRLLAEDVLKIKQPGE